MIELDRKRNYNRECLGAFRRSEIQPNNKLWMAFSTSGDNNSSLFLKLPRKNLVTMIELEQVRLNSRSEAARLDIKKRVRDLKQMGSLETLDMDPYVLEMLVKEEKGGAKDEDDSD